LFVNGSFLTKAQNLRFAILVFYLREATMRQDSSSPDSLRFAKDSNCSYRSIQTLRCFTELDANGKPQQKCQRIYKKFKECPGRLGPLSTLLVLKIRC